MKNHFYELKVESIMDGDHCGGSCGLVALLVLSTMVSRAYGHRKEDSTPAMKPAYPYVSSLKCLRRNQVRLVKQPWPASNMMNLGIDPVHAAPLIQIQLLHETVAPKPLLTQSRAR